MQLENIHAIEINPFLGDSPHPGIVETTTVNLAEDEANEISVDLNADMDTSDKEEVVLPSPVASRGEHAIIERGVTDDPQFGVYINPPLADDKRRCLERAYAAGNCTSRRNTDVYLRIPIHSFRKLKPVPVSGSYRARDYWFDNLIINQYMILLSKRDAVKKNKAGRTTLLTHWPAINLWNG
jgi:hypothetical protein